MLIKAKVSRDLSCTLTSLLTPYLTWLLDIYSTVPFLSPEEGGLDQTNSNHSTALQKSLEGVRTDDMRDQVRSGQVGFFRYTVWP